MINEVYKQLADSILLQEKFHEYTPKQLHKMPHHLYKAYPEDIEEGKKFYTPYPTELFAFYESIGYGFFYRNKGEINYLLDPMSLIMFNQQLGEMKYDKNLEEYLSGYDIHEKLIFFKYKNDTYLAIDRYDRKGENAIYYKQNKISHSLTCFIQSYCNKKNWLDYLIEK